MEVKALQDTLTIDPVAMNVVNRVAPGSTLNGDSQCSGGLLVQGEIAGNVRVNGPLIIWLGGVVRGSVQVMGDLYLFGRLGAPDASAQDTVVKCFGMAYVANTGVATGTLLARRLKLYDGADLQGPFRTINLADNVPVLNEVQAEPANAS